MVPIAVEARFEPDGTLLPLAFEWEQRRFAIEDYGRQWEENGSHYFLVMVTGDRVFELVYLQDESQWQLVRSPNDFNGYSFV